MEQQARFDGEHACGKHEALPCQAGGQISPVLDRMHDERLKSQRHAAKILLQIPQITAENAPAAAAETPAQLRREPGLRGDEAQVVFLEQSLHRPVLIERERQALIHREIRIGPYREYSVQKNQS